MAFDYGATPAGFVDPFNMGTPWDGVSTPQFGEPGFFDFQTALAVPLDPRHARARALVGLPASPPGVQHPLEAPNKAGINRGGPGLHRLFRPRFRLPGEGGFAPGGSLVPPEGAGFGGGSSPPPSARRPWPLFSPPGPPGPGQGQGGRPGFSPPVPPPAPWVTPGRTGPGQGLGGPGQLMRTLMQGKTSGRRTPPPGMTDPFE